VFVQLFVSSVYSKLKRSFKSMPEKEEINHWGVKCIVFHLFSHGCCTPVTLSVLTPEAIPSQKCYENMGSILIT